jgi:hypothetical protein
VSGERESVLQRLQSEWPYLVEFLEALREGGGAPKLIYLEMNGVVVRGTELSSNADALK